jgi:hypothetical protein
MRFIFLLAALSIVTGCRFTPSEPRERIDLYPSPTVLPTQTERVVQITTTPVFTYTPIVKVVTETPKPGYLCVTADENVYLRPSADLTGYPIAPLPNGSRLTDLGGRNGSFAFVSYGEFSGWVHLKFVINCK